MNQQVLEWRQVKKILRQSEEKYRHLREFHQRIFDKVPVSIIVINKKGVIVAANKHFLNFSDESRVVGQCIFDMDFFIKEGLLDDYRNIFRTGKAFARYDCRTMNKKRKVKFINILAVSLKDINGKIEGIISMAIDNTETHRTQNKLTKLNLELKKEIERRKKVENNLNKIVKKLRKEARSGKK